MKSQVLVDFLVELPQHQDTQPGRDQKEAWTLYVDGSSLS